MTQLQNLSSTPSDSNQDSFVEKTQKIMIKGHNLKREPVEMEKSMSDKASMFQHFDVQNDKYSNTTEKEDIFLNDTAGD